MSQLKNILSQYWNTIQGNLFPCLEEKLSPLTEKQRQLVTILEMVRIEQYIPSFCPGFRGRPEKNRKAIARAFIAKAIYNIPTTTMLIDRLHSDISLRRICGWEKNNEIPSESVFSRAFLEFTNSHLLNRAHEALIKTYYSNEIVGHAITDATAIEGREKANKREMTIEEKDYKKKYGRSKKLRKKPNQMTRIEKQASGQMTLKEMLKDLPILCDRGAKTNSKGNLQWWNGYKLHLTVDDHGVPLAGIISSASLHDSQAAIPLSNIVAQRVVNLYDIMDSGYYIDGIIEHSKAQGHIPIIEKPADRGKREDKLMEKKAWKAINFKPAEMVRYEVRSTVERTFSRLKSEFGANFVRVRGWAKVYTHLMFGIISLAADQLIKIVI